MFATVSLNGLTAWCRALRHGLHAGLSPVRVFRQQEKSGPAKMRPVAGRVADRLETGDSLADAFAPEAVKFPPLFLELMAMGEAAGRLPDVFGELEDYYIAVGSARKKFFAALAWPVMMYVGAVAVITVMIAVLGMVAPAGQKPFDPLGFGLTGSGGAVAFLMLAAGFTVLVVSAAIFLASNPGVRAKVEARGLGVPVIGPCLRAFALYRFAMAFHMTAESGVRADRGLKTSLRATANRAYADQADRLAKMARTGKEVTAAVASCGPRLFPADFVDAVAVGEESGQLAEVMQRQAKYYQEEAVRGMNTITKIAGGLVYGGVAVMIIFLIFRIASSIFGIYDDALKGI